MKMDSSKTEKTGSTGAKQASPDLIMGKMPLTFYIQKQQSLVTLGDEEKSAAAKQQPRGAGGKPTGVPGGAKKKP
ncbi:MAG: hypothetical protein A2Z86_12640 [Candidatus Glassbacteria bacterium GWA2_58_10]|uniref:Uncharacterized protein n=1 Tax=Candidatus Glassbacteria bacterium GWA2_58_10 TaxID=1817865 RepID=A0A1F5YCB9_9BACT|nr:MAG: hypothetical protein A2Z86_12640 [Candidatus Glassbacteria bacterium GWA2_58_10]